MMPRRAAIFIALAAWCASAAAQVDPLIPPTARSPDCTTSGCHASQIAKPFLHGPNALPGGGACDMCHEYQDIPAHRFTLKHEGRALCDFCHVDKSGQEGPIVHDPVAKGQCVACHDPHGAGNRKMLKGETGPQLCTECHKDAMTGRHLHKPVGENCTTCHTPHAGQHARLLTAEPKQLCVSCHEQVGKEAAGSKYPHEPASDCLQCHAPHAANEARILKQPAKDLCVSCHAEVGRLADSAAHKHAAVSDAKACLNCHTAHGSEHAKQLAADPVASCLACHAKPVVTKGRTIAGVPELAIDANHRHGPIVNGRCVDCHDVHGGDKERLLVKPYATAFYQEFREDSVGLCLSCHDAALIAAEEVRDEGTAFRNGARNLHFVHVMKGDQGRSCRSCHTPHASRFGELIAESVPYGKWNMPINFKPSTTGGSCAPGCHKPESYDRINPIAPSNKDSGLP